MLDLKNLRRENLSQILFQLHFQGEKRRAALSEELGIRLNSMNSLMEELQTLGLIKPTQPEKARSAFKIDTENHWCFGIRTDKDGCHLKVISLGGDTLHSQHIPTYLWKPEAFVQKVKELTAHFSSIMKKPPLGVGVAMAGITQNGFIIRSIQFGPWHQVPLQAMLQQELGVPVIVENDTRCALNGEQWFHLKDLSKKSIYAVALGHGVSSAIMIKGELHSGGQSAAGEIGHVPVENKGRPCLCGKLDCLEAYCKTEEVLEQINVILKTDRPIKSLSELSQWIPQNPGITNVIDQIAQLLCKVLVPVVAALDTDTLMIMSDLKEYSQLITAALNRHFDQRLIGHEAHGIHWLPRGSLTETCCSGAAALVIQNIFKLGGEPSSHQSKNC